jgi:PAS domain S-box-containing protein
MKHAIAPTTVERRMREDDFIVSKTDLKGHITYGNRIFIEFSGYTEEELLGAQHNIIRHPDMPRAMFQLLWNDIQDGREHFAYLKNLAKDGSHYWVLANVTPSYDQNNRMIGYFSVRRKPADEGVRYFTDLYRTMLAAEQQAGPHDAIAASTKILDALLAEKHATINELVLSF